MSIVEDNLTLIAYVDKDIESELHARFDINGFPKVFKCENELVKATLMYLDDPDAPEGVAFIRWLAVQDYLGEKINWKDLT